MTNISDASSLGGRRHLGTRLASVILKCTVMLVIITDSSAFHTGFKGPLHSTGFSKMHSNPARLTGFQSTSAIPFPIQSALKGRNYQTTGHLKMSVSNVVMKANLAVTLDTPIIPFYSSTKSKVVASSGFWRGFLTILLSDAFKTAVLAFFLALTLSLFARSPSSITSQSMKQNMRDNYKLAKGKIIRLFNIVKSKLGTIASNGTQGTPLIFDKDNDGQVGWGVASLLSKKKLGETSYVQYDFQLPLPEHTLPLALGQQLDLCCLSNDNQVNKGAFYLFSDREKKGSFSIVAPLSKENEDKAITELGTESGKFARVLDAEFSVGDEVAIKPGNNTLSYRGQHLPVTDMVYFTSGMGIVPILQQIKAILPDSSSSVKMVTIIWVNDDPKNFDIAFKELEDEYFKYNMKLEVSCVVDNLVSPLKSNPEIEDALPNFRPGTMAVISGSSSFVEKANEYLVEGRDYPEDCLCSLA